jgi:hypothetical protein
VANHKIPTYGDITSLYLDGMTKEEIIHLYEADVLQVNVRSRKHDTKIKIAHFFNVIEGSKRAYVENPRARVDKANLLFYVNKKTRIPTTSIKKVLDALEKQGWSLQEATRDMEYLDRSLKRR